MLDHLIEHLGASDSSKAHNEDAYGVSGNTFWVIDGSCSSDSSSDNAGVSRYSAQLSHALEELTDISFGMPLSELVGWAHDHALTSWSNSRISAVPTASIAVARALPDAVEMYVLGDCSAFVSRSGMIEEVSDPRFRTHEKPILDRVRSALTLGKTSEQAYALITPALKEYRRLRSTPRRRRILGADRSASAHGITRIFLYDPAQPMSVTLMSDGYRRAWDTYYLHLSRGEFLRATRRDPEAVIRRIRVLESADPNRERYPRLSDTDDATVLVATRGGHGC